MTTSPSKWWTRRQRLPSSKFPPAWTPSRMVVMLRKLGCLAMVLGLALPVWAGEKPGSISGYVRNAGGVPQMGAVVEVLGSAFHSLRVFTDVSGFYSASGLLPGVYNIKVSAPYFLPVLRQRVGLGAGGSVVV